MAQKVKNKIFLFPLALAVIFFASIIIIFSPVGKKTIIKVIPTIIPTPSPKPIYWQTYTNSSDNYQISYLSSWKVTKEAEKVILEKPDYARISIDSSNEQGITLPIMTWISRSNTKLLNDPNPHPATTTISIIDNDNVLKNIPNVVTVNAEFFGQGGKEYIFPHQKKIFSITGIYFVEDLSVEEQIVSVSAEINEILSTFKFLPDTSNWKTYKNKEHGFEFKYPASLSLRSKITDFEAETVYLSNSKGQDVFMMEYIFSGISFSKDVDTPLPPQTFGDNTFIPLDTETWVGNVYIYQNKYRIWVSSNYSDQEILTQIISSIKFIDPTDISTWKTYQNTQYGFEFKYPSNLDIQHKKSENIKYLFSLSSPKIKYIKSPLNTDIVSMGTEYRLFFDNEKCDAWNDNFGLYGFGSFQKISIGSNRGNKTYDGPSQNTYAANIEINKGCLSIFGEYGTDTINNSRSEFDQILSTYKFLPTNLVSPTITAAKYICPASEWVDCMPGPNQGVKLECTPEALNWFKLNCPNFKGAAL